MSKPNDIPQDVWDSAYAACNAKFDPYSRAYVEDVARAIMAAKAECMPNLGNTGTYLAKDNAGQWHYINHAGTWQGCPPPFPSVEDEREACAQIAEDSRIDPEVDHVGLVDGANRACVKIAAAIRKRGDGSVNTAHISENRDQ